MEKKENMSMTIGEKEETILEVRVINDLVKIVKTSENRVAATAGNAIIEETQCGDEDQADVITDKWTGRYEEEIRLNNLELKVITGIIATIIEYKKKWES